MVEPPTFADIGVNTSDNTIESFKQEIELLTARCADYKKETKIANSKVEGLENEINELKSALAKAKADLLMAESRKEEAEAEVKVSVDIIDDLKKQLEILEQ